MKSNKLCASKIQWDRHKDGQLIPKDRRSKKEKSDRYSTTPKPNRTNNSEPEGSRVMLLGSMLYLPGSWVEVLPSGPSGVEVLPPRLHQAGCGPQGMRRPFPDGLAKRPSLALCLGILQNLGGDTQTPIAHSLCRDSTTRALPKLTCSLWRGGHLSLCHPGATGATPKAAEEQRTCCSVGSRACDVRPAPHPHLQVVPTVVLQEPEVFPLKSTAPKISELPSGSSL